VLCVGATVNRCKIRRRGVLLYEEQGGSERQLGPPGERVVAMPLDESDGGDTIAVVAPTPTQLVPHGPDKPAQGSR
jgi:hypothetical protein